MAGSSQFRRALPQLVANSQRIRRVVVDPSLLLTFLEDPTGDNFGGRQPCLSKCLAPFLEPVCFVFSRRSEEHTSELQSLMRTSYAVFCLIQKTVCCLHNSTNN